MMTPSMDLALEVLAARYRLGEPFWTFRSEHRKTLRALEAEGLVYLMHGVVERTIRAGLTEEGKKACLSGTYQQPVALTATDGVYGPIDPEERARIRNSAG